jgi:predicted metalloprotease
MRWIGGRESTNIEDRRGMSMGRGIVGGGIGTIVLILIGLFFGVDPSALLDSVGTAPVEQGMPAPETQAEAAQRKFVSVVLAQTEDTWGAIFQRMGRRYDPPRLVLFTGVVQSACGMAQSASGPFYCPGDQRVYLDLSFLSDLSTRFGAPGEFARAYVIAHEVGHHVQGLLGTLASGEDDRYGASGSSVRTELQADCFAGIWARRTDQAQHILEQGDLENALQAAASVGDDRLQLASTGRVVPDSFTHGSSAQRTRWFKRGFDSGNLANCDTFSELQL